MSRREITRKKSIPRVVFAWTFQILLVIMFAYVAVYFFGQTRTNVGQSMDVTISGGDTVLLNVMAYKLNGPSRGDVIAFRTGGSSDSQSNIKRTRYLRVETVQIKDGMIYIDGAVYLEQKNYPAITNRGWHRSLSIWGSRNILCWETTGTTVRTAASRRSGR